MTTRNPIVKFVGPGVVCLMLDVDTAIAVADSVEFGVASGGLTTIGRPLGNADVDVIREAAAQAAEEADPDVLVLLGDQPKVPQLRLVGGDDQC